MPRDLADVLHYFLPELDEAPDAELTETGSSAPGRGEGAPDDDAGAGAVRRPHPPLPILGVPMGERDVVRAALAWNLSIETARLGGSTVIVAPETDRGSPLWPAPQVGPPGSEFVFCAAKDLVELHAAAAELAVARAERARRGGLVMVRVPLAWLVGAPGIQNPIRWLLLLATSTGRELEQTFDLLRALVRANPVAEIGVTIRGAGTIAAARHAFERLARRSEEELDSVLISYGLLVDDLEIYREIAAARPIGLTRPQAPAARALMDVARLLYEDARSRVLG